MDTSKNKKYNDWVPIYHEMELAPSDMKYVIKKLKKNKIRVVFNSHGLTENERFNENLPAEILVHPKDEVRAIKISDKLDFL